jgi:hypothetical protein
MFTHARWAALAAGGAKRMHPMFAVWRHRDKEILIILTIKPENLGIE